MDRPRRNEGRRDASEECEFECLLVGVLVAVELKGRTRCTLTACLRMADEEGVEDGDMRMAMLTCIDCSMCCGVLCVESGVVEREESDDF